MKITLGQINTTPGDFEGNVIQILEGITKAAADQSNVALFPEMAVCGYLAKDLLFQKSFIEKNYAALQRIAAHTVQYPNLFVVVGYAGWNTKGSGKPFTNSAAVIKNGAIIANYNKQLICFYDVFDEGRYFAPDDEPCVIEIDGQRVGIAICEDVWNDKGQVIDFYDRNPVERYRELKIQGLLILNSSPFYTKKWFERQAMLTRTANGEPDNPIQWVAYCNQYGGQDELVFDGHSTTICNGVALHDSGTGTSFQSVEIKPASKSKYNFGVRPANGMKELYDMLLLGLEQYVHKTGFTDVVLGSSGGIDSALVATLASKALGAEHVHCLRMPSKWSSSGSLDHSAELHTNLGCHEYTVPIKHDGLLQLLDTNMGFGDDYNPVAKENIQARLRAIAVMHMSNAKGYLPLTTGNKTEIALGYCTINGDMVGGYNPIGDLYKSQVYGLAKWINKTFGPTIPEEIINKPPSAELAPGQTDEGSLKLSYDILDAIAQSYIEDRISTYEEYKKRFALEKQQLDEETYKRIIDRIDRMEFKRHQSAPIIKVSKQAFGTGRRMPIATNKTMRI